MQTNLTKHQAALNRAIDSFRKTYPKCKHVIIIGVDPNNPPSYIQLMEELHKQMIEYNRFDILHNKFLST